MKKILISLLFAITLGQAVYHLFNVILAGESRLLQWLPDDTFYYLNLVKHFSAQGIWTFDGGQTLTTGFHPLWAYLLLPIIYSIGDDPLLLMQTVACFSFTLAMSVVLRVAISFFKKEAFLPLAVLAVFLSAISFLANSISGMEWSLAFVISALYFWHLAYYPEQNIKSKLSYIFLLGLLGSLARSEFGALTFAGFSSALLLFLLIKQSKYLLPSSVGLSGATVGLGLIFLHNLYFGGDWLQSSSQIKFFWSDAFGHTPVPIFLQTARIIFYIPVLKLDIQDALKLVNYANSLLIIGGIILGSSALILVSKNRTTLMTLVKTEQNAAFLFIFALLTICYYFIIYAFNAFASQIWYTVFLTAPVFILVTFSLALLARHVKPLIITAGLAIITITNLSFFHTALPIYQGQELGKLIGLTVKQITQERVGISDAGIVNFYQGGTIINTDGLVNNEIETYLYAGRLECYLLDKQIKYTTGFGSSEQASIKKGHPIAWETFSELQWFAYNDFQIALRRVDFSRLAKLPTCAM